MVEEVGAGSPDEDAAAAAAVLMQTGRGGLGRRILELNWTETAESAPKE